MTQRRKLYDGLSDDFRIQGGRIYRASSRPVASIAALSWAAEREGESYGRFILKLTRTDEARIQAEYEAFITQRTGDANVRREMMQAHEDNTPYIKNDEDIG